MARRFAKFQEKKLKKRFFYPSDLVNTSDCYLANSLQCPAVLHSLIDVTH